VPNRRLPHHLNYLCRKPIQDWVNIPQLLDTLPSWSHLSLFWERAGTQY
jgi:hypothetical protein